MDNKRRFTAPADLGRQSEAVSQSQLDVWKGDTIPPVLRHTSTWDVIRRQASNQEGGRYQRVNKLIETFNSELAAMRDDDNLKALDNLLPSDQRRRFKSQINDLAREFLEQSKNAVKGAYEFKQLDNLYKELAEIHKNFSQTAKMCLPIDAKLTSIREVQDNLRVRGYLPQGQESMIKDFERHFQQVKEYPDRPILGRNRKLEELRHDLVEMHDDLHKAKGMYDKLDEIKSYSFLFLSEEWNEIDNDISKANEYIKIDSQENKKIRDESWKEVSKWLDNMIKFIHEKYRNNLQQRIKECQQQFDQHWPQFAESRRHGGSGEEWKKFSDGFKRSFERDMQSANVTRDSLVNTTEQNKVIASQDLTLYHQQALRLEQKVLTMRIMMLKNSKPAAYQALSRLVKRTNKLMEETFNEFNTSTLPEQDKQKRRHEYIVSFNGVYESIAQAVETSASQESPREGSDDIIQAQEQFAQLRYVYQKEKLDRVTQGITVWQRWFDKNFPASNTKVESHSDSEASRLQSIRSKFQNASARADSLTSYIAEQAKSSDVTSELHELESYEEIFSAHALELIQTSPEVPRYHKEELTALVQQGKQAKGEGSKVLAEDPDLYLDLQRYNESASRSIREAVRLCGPKENLEKIDSFIDSARYSVFDLKHRIFLHTDPYIYNRVSKLRERYTKIHKDIERFIGDDEILKQNLADNDRFFFVSLIQMGDSREQKNTATLYAKQFLDKLNKMRIKTNHEYIDKRVNGFKTWFNDFYLPIADSGLYEGFDPLFRRDMLYFLKSAQGIEVNFQQNSHEQETTLRQHAEVCQKIEEQVINLFLVANRHGETRQLVRSLKDDIDQAHGNDAFSQTDQQEARTFYMQAYSTLADGIIKFGKLEFFGRDEPDSQFLAEAWTQLDKLKALSSAQQVHQSPRGDDRPSSHIDLLRPEEPSSSMPSSEVDPEEVASPQDTRQSPQRRSPDILPITPQEQTAPQDTSQYPERQQPPDILPIASQEQMVPQERQYPKRQSPDISLKIPQAQMALQDTRQSPEGQQPPDISPIEPQEQTAPQDTSQYPERQPSPAISPISPQEVQMSFPNILPILSSQEEISSSLQHRAEQNSRLDSQNIAEEPVTPQREIPSQFQQEAGRDSQSDSGQQQQDTSEDDQRTQQRIEALWKWHVSVDKTDTSANVQVIHSEFISSFEEIKRIELKIKSNTDKDELEFSREQYARMCHQMEESVIDWYLATNNDEKIKELISLRKDLDQAYRIIHGNDAFSQTDQQQAHTFYTRAYSVMADGIIESGQQQFFDADAPVSEFLAEARTQLESLRQLDIDETQGDHRDIPPMVSSLLGPI